MNPLNTCIIPKFYTMDGGHVKEMGVIAWGQPYKIKTSWSPVGSQQRPLASVNPNDTHPYIEQNHEPNQLPGGSTLLCRGGKGTLTKPAPNDL